MERLNDCVIDTDSLDRHLAERVVSMDTKVPELQDSTMAAGALDKGLSLVILDATLEPERGLSTVRG